MRGGLDLRKNEAMDATRLFRLVALAGLLLLAACATQQHSRDLLKVSLYDYSGAIRWNRFDAAAQFLDPEQLAKKPVTALELQRYEQIQVTGYYVKGSEQPAPTEWRQLVEIRFVNRHTQAERIVMVQERWRYDEAARRWWLTSGLPDITAAR
jgi:hypothetical protein